MRKICKDVARNTYVYNSLKDSKATIETLVDVTWELGKRYTIKQPGSNSEGSSTLFSGWLFRVEHKIISNTSSPSASTVLTFSHVEANGFTLPNK